MNRAPEWKLTFLTAQRGAGTVDKELNAARERLTGSFLDAYTKLVNDVVIPGSRDKKISAVAQVPAAASVSATSDHAVALVFDQPIVWNDALAGQFYLDGAKGKVSSGVLEKNVLTLTLKEPSAATKITYLKESAWSQDKLVRGFLFRKGSP